LRTPEPEPAEPAESKPIDEPAQPDPVGKLLDPLTVELKGAVIDPVQAIVCRYRDRAPAVVFDGLRARPLP
jgi:hypothetical protein